jgi:hypothetical protein
MYVVSVQRTVIPEYMSFSFGHILFETAINSMLTVQVIISQFTLFSDSLNVTSWNQMESQTLKVINS